MIKIVIITHGDLAESLMRTSEMIFGHSEGVFALTFPSGTDRADLLKKFEGLLHSCGSDPVIILTDMLGGSAFMCAAPLATGPDRLLITGANLPLLLDLLSERSRRDLQELEAHVREKFSAYVTVYQEVNRNE